ncbi:MAG: hypothetical protein R2851_00785 [Caldilineaceae bacterium]
MFFNSYPDTLYFVALVAVDDPDTLAVVAGVEAHRRRRAAGLRIISDDGELALLDTLLDDINLSEDLDDLDLPQLLSLTKEVAVTCAHFAGTMGQRPQEARGPLGIVAGSAPPNTRNWTTTGTLWSPGDRVNERDAALVQ